MKRNWMLLLFFGLLFLLSLCSCTDQDDDDDNDDDDSTDDDDDDYEITEGFVFIPAGEFMMGSPEDEPGHHDTEPLHKVTLTYDFEIMETEVTQDNYLNVVGFNPSHFAQYGSDCPVEMITWFDALYFANALSAINSYQACYILSEIECREGEYNEIDGCNGQGGILEAEVILNGVNSVYACEGFRLPTEAEWEYAARAGMNSSLHNGGVITEFECYYLDSALDEIAWYCANSEEISHPVKLKEQNNWGLYDISGNVTEWVWDWWNPDPSVDTINPEGPNGEDTISRTSRGGSLDYGAANCRSASRGRQGPGYPDYNRGFRLVRTLN